VNSKKGIGDDGRCADFFHTPLPITSLNQNTGNRNVSSMTSREKHSRYPEETVINTHVAVTTGEQDDCHQAAGKAQ
jgi:hypothetical protein